jgi:MarR family transcriptional regulator, organic hydroperoxide resistance regulator
MTRRQSRLQAEIKQAKPFGSVYQEALLSVLRTADVLRRTIARQLEPHELTPQQYNVLRILRGAGERGLPTLEIGERLIEQMPGMTRLIDRLEAKRLVERARCETDRRQVFCRLSEAGRALLTLLDGAIGSADEALRVALPEREAETLVVALERVRLRAEQSSGK